MTLSTLYMRSTKTWLRLLVLAVCLAFSVALIWYNFNGTARHSGLLTFVLLVVLYGLVTTGVVPLPQGSNIPLFTLWSNLSDASKAVASFLLIFLWTPIAKQLVPDTPVGASILLIPDGVFLLAALVYFSNGLSRNLK